MLKYPKIKTAWLRDPDNHHKTLLDGQWATPEIEYLKDNAWVFTEKVDGTNIRIMWDGERVRFGGRTARAQIPTFLLDKLQDLFPDEKLAENFGLANPSTIEQPVCLYGEGYGARIQKGGGNYIPDGVSFILFDVQIGNWWLQREDVEGIGANLGIDVVPVISIGPLEQAVRMVDDGLESELRSGWAEGLVMKPAVELAGRNGKRIIAKIKHKDFSR